MSAKTYIKTALAIVLVLSTLAPIAAAEKGDLTELSLEALMDIEVTSVSKRGEQLGESAAAVFVLTQDDIRRSGATSIPEVLRLAPGLHVARIDSTRWAISARGFNGLFANTLLVLIDGRTVYTPLFSGVFWDVQDTLLTDIERIEIIRGPGAAVWGANAVNGVINIITKHSKDTVGGLGALKVGTEDRNITALRYGATLADGLTGRIYGKYANRDSTGLADNSGEAFDSWEHFQTGMRLDWKGSGDEVTLQGDLYGGREQFSPIVSLLTAPFLEQRQLFSHTRGGNALARWAHTVSTDSVVTSQVYYDRADRTDRRDGLVDARFDTFDAEVQYQHALSASNVMQSGLGYRAIDDELADGYDVKFERGSSNTNLISGFFQDEQTFLDGALRVTLGARLDNNEYTGTEVQPSLRGAWIPSKGKTLWAAVSRAVHTPSRTDNDVMFDFGTTQLPSGGTLASRLLGNRDLSAEQLVAYEVGYRQQFSDSFSFDAACFFNHYDHLYTLEPGVPFPISESTLVVPITFRNHAQADSYGAELLADWRVSPRWSLRGWYSLLVVNSWADPDTGGAPSDEEHSAPRNQFALRSQLDLSDKLVLDAQLRYVGSVPAFGIDHYTELDVRLGWQVNDDIELAIAGVNLLSADHEEYISNFVTLPPTSIERGIVATATVKF